MCSLPVDLRWKDLLGLAFLGGIGFTMSIFITVLAFDNEALIEASKISIIITSVIAGILGFCILKLFLKKPIELNRETEN